MVHFRLLFGFCLGVLVFGFWLIVLFFVFVFLVFAGWLLFVVFWPGNTHWTMYRSELLFCDPSILTDMYVLSN